MSCLQIASNFKQIAKQVLFQKRSCFLFNHVNTFLRVLKVSPMVPILSPYDTWIIFGYFAWSREIAWNLNSLNVAQAPFRNLLKLTVPTCVINRTLSYLIYLSIYLTYLTKEVSIHKKGFGSAKTHVNDFHKAQKNTCGSGSLTNPIFFFKPHFFSTISSMQPYFLRAVLADDMVCQNSSCLGNNYNF